MRRCGSFRPEEEKTGALKKPLLEKEFGRVCAEREKKERKERKKRRESEKHLPRSRQLPS